MNTPIVNLDPIENKSNSNNSLSSKTITELLGQNGLGMLPNFLSEMDLECYQTS
ncbi:hypothetical protein C1645_826440 [Glomus cerebriforme]|uniref:Uncharacterized protein n=1 Tax=Glomus cerebriforme TaxID=658196 RepID=A0A397SZZ7_9GLOM|nr:hypothetical protein C1645_826440 [Glomus cerebriforme]